MNENENTEVTKNQIITKEKILGVLGGFGTIILYFLLSGVASIVLKPYLQSTNKTVVSITYLGFYIFLLLVLGLIYHKRLINDFKNFKKDNVNIAVKNWLIGLSFMIASNLIISTFVGDIAANENANRALLDAYPISSAITMIVIAPLIEEITFRASFKKGFDKWYTFAIVTAILFGGCHIAKFSLLELLFIIPYSSLGFFFAKAFYETNNIFTSYLAHFMHNGLVIISLFLF